MSRPIYLMLVFWGKEFADRFYSLLLPTLLAPGNIPALPHVRFLIHTTREDWNDLKSRPLVERLMSLCTVDVVFILPPKRFRAPQFHMSESHLAMVKHVHRNKAIGGFLTPDMMLSESLLSDAARELDGGAVMVLTPALRFSEEKVLARLHMIPDEPCAIPAPLMGSIAVSSLHPQIRNYEFHSRMFGPSPIWTWWRVPQRDGMVMHTVNWTPVLADYVGVPRIIEDSLVDNTIDAFFVGDHFGHLLGDPSVVVFSDSSRGMLLGVTPEHEARFKVRKPLRHIAIDLVGGRPWRRNRQVRRFHHGSILDPWRRWLHKVPAVIHGDTRDERYDIYTAHSRMMMERMTREGRA